MLEIEKTIATSQNHKYFSLNRNEFMLSFYNLISIVHKRSPIPSLSDIKISVKDNELILTSNDMEILISESIDIIGGNFTGILTTPAHTMYNIIKRLSKDSMINFIIKNNSIILHSSENSKDSEKENIRISESTFSIPITDATKFPVMSYVDIYQTTTISSKDLKFLLEKTKSSIANDNIRYNLGGVFFEINFGTRIAKVFSTDSHRLSFATKNITNEKHNEYQGIESVIIPRKTVLELIRIINDKDENVNISLCSKQGQLNRIKFSFLRKEIVSKLISGTFPDCQSVIPKTHKIKLSIQKDYLLPAIERVSVVLDDLSRQPISITLSKNKIKIEAQNHINNGMAKEILYINDIQHEFVININCSYITDALHNIDSNFIDIFLNDSDSAVTIKDQKNSSYIHVIMPFSIQN